MPLGAIGSNLRLWEDGGATVGSGRDTRPVGEGDGGLGFWKDGYRDPVQDRFSDTM